MTLINDIAAGHQSITRIASSDAILADPALRAKAQEALSLVTSIQRTIAARTDESAAGLRTRAVAAAKGMGESQRCLLSQFPTEREPSTEALAMLSGVETKQATRSLDKLEERGLVYGMRWSINTLWRTTELGAIVAEMIANDQPIAV